MRYRTVTVREGENCGPVDWLHPTAADMPDIWREAERDPGSFLFSEYGWPVIALCMYDGWPYWEPRPAILYVGPLGRAEWTFFNSYAVWPSSIRRRPASVDTRPKDGDSAQTEAPLASGAVPSEETADAQPSEPRS